MAALITEPTQEHSCSLESVNLCSCDVLDLFNFFDRIAQDAKTEQHIKDMMVKTNAMIAQESKDKIFIAQLIPKLSIDETLTILFANIDRFNFDIISSILETKKIPNDHPKCNRIYNKFGYSSKSEAEVCKMLKMLIDYGFDWKSHHYEAFIYAAYAAKYADAVAILLDAGMNVNQTLSNGETLIEYISDDPSNPVIKLLIERGAHVTKKGKEHLSPELFQLLEQRDAAAVQASLPLAMPAASSIKQQQADLVANLEQQIKTATADKKFETYQILVDAYHHFVKPFVAEYNSKSVDFIATFDEATSTLTVAWRE